MTIASRANEVSGVYNWELPVVWGVAARSLITSDSGAAGADISAWVITPLKCSKAAYAGGAQTCLEQLAAQNAACVADFTCPGNVAITLGQAVKALLNRAPRQARAG